MKRLINNIESKAKSNIGESIGEVLIALLISSLALVMLASMISSAQNMVHTSENKMDSYYSANNELVEQSGSAKSKQMTISGTSVSVSESVNVYGPNDVLRNEVYAYYRP